MSRDHFCRVHDQWSERGEKIRRMIIKVNQNGGTHSSGGQHVRDKQRRFSTVPREGNWGSVRSRETCRGEYIYIYIYTMLCEEDRPRRRIFRTEKPVPQRTRCRRAPRTTRQCNSSVARTKNIRHIVHAKKKKKISDNNNVTLVIGFTREDTRLHVLHDLIFLYLFTVCSVSSVFLWSWFWIKEFTWNLNVYRFLYRSYWFSNL